MKRSKKFSSIMTGLVFGILALESGCTQSGEKADINSNSDSAQQAPADPMQDRGIGPITTDLKLEAVNPALASKGKAVFQVKCSACHKIEEKYVGPALKGVTLRRRPEWIMNMILNPGEMTQKDAIAKDLLAKHLTQMTFQNVNQEEVRQILEFFRQNDSTGK